MLGSNITKSAFVAHPSTVLKSTSRCAAFHVLEITQKHAVATTILMSTKIPPSLLSTTAQFRIMSLWVAILKARTAEL
jgi:hypothetical protein